jgi:DNA-binding NarL/FixJ family response regulator
MCVQAEVVDIGCLTKRQSEILRLVCEGATDKVIARELSISIKTVSANCEQIYLRMAIRQNAINTRCTAIATAVARGMVKIREIRGGA